MKNKSISRILHETEDIYNRIAPDFSDTRGKWWRPPAGLAEYLRDEMKVIDLGCGNGRFAELFRGRPIQYFGIDQSEELIKICRKRFAGEPNIKFEVGDITDLKSGQKFDLALVIAVLHHLPTRELRLKALKNVFDILSPGGRLMMRNWNLWNAKTAKLYWRHLFDFYYKIKSGVWGINDAFIPWKSRQLDSRRFVHSFTKKEIKNLLQEVGFENINVYYESYASDQPVSIWNGYNLVAIATKK